MAKREDGKETRWRLLNAACDVFAKKGYRDARVADICRQADANVASVNYYFGDKESLYKEAWEYALRDMNKSVFSESNVGTGQERLQTFIQNLIQNFAAEGDLGRFGRLYLVEMVNPTGLIQDAWHDMIEPNRRKLHAIIRDILGTEAQDRDIRFCELSIVNQCRMFVTVKRSDLEYMLGEPLNPALIQQLASHIADFSLAGIQAVGRRERE